MNEIIFFGSTHIGQYALVSLQKSFEKIYILSGSSDDVLDLKRPCDVIIDDFFDVECKYIFLGGYPNLIDERFIRKKTFIKLHGSLLPKYRGYHSLFWGIMNGENEMGITYHLVDKGMDTGDILEQFSYKYFGQPIHEINDTIHEFVTKNTGRIVLDYIEGKITPTKQDHSKATYSCKRNLEDTIVDFNLENIYLERLFKALTPPYPLPRIVVKNEVFEILDYKIIYNNYFSAIGRVLNIDDEGAWIKTKEGFLIIKNIRNVSSMEIKDIRKTVKNGHRFLK